MRIIIVSNRAPVTLKRGEHGMEFQPSSGGLATGLRSFVEHQRKVDPSTEMIWVGWPGEAVTEDERSQIEDRLLRDFAVKPVFLDTDVMERFYQGFCNATLWPLFHYFPSRTQFAQEQWDEYISVNQRFADTVMSIAKPGDVIWVHDYHLMLLPQMLRKRMPQASIGFFLHIPFPSYEIFRLLPNHCRRALLNGVYGSDLIGFHTHDYGSYFLHSTQRILGFGDRIGEVLYDDRLVRVASFPMGIDYDLFHDSVAAPEVLEQRESLRSSLGPQRLILSIDRQDYTKGILKRLEGFAHFLKTHPEWSGSVTLVMVVIPSRAGVEDYREIKAQIDGTVGMINGQYGSLGWVPIIYQYRSLSFAELIAIYAESDVALVTPLRDGMNLVAKEYIASRVDDRGVLILSEMAGAVDELDSSIIINPHNNEEIAQAIDQALRMPHTEQRDRLNAMQRRIEKSNVVSWATDFLSSLSRIKREQQRLAAKELDSQTRQKLLDRFTSASSRIFFLDYDGTLTPIVGHPSEAVPSEELLETLRELTQLENTRVVILSGRDRATLEHWFGELDVDLAAEHGLIIKRRHSGWTPVKRSTDEWVARLLSKFKSLPFRQPGSDEEALLQDWRTIKPVRDDWKDDLRPVLDHYAERLPGSFVEEKEFSLVFHYRNANQQIAQGRIKELVHHLTGVTSRLDLQLLQGKKVLEIRHAGVDKGIAAASWLTDVRDKDAFILCAGDDTTDEDLFKVMPEHAFSIKVGKEVSNAQYNLESPAAVLDLLHQLADAQLHA